jgi:hypothetical protein
MDDAIWDCDKVQPIIFQDRVMQTTSRSVAASQTAEENIESSLPKEREKSKQISAEAKPEPEKKESTSTSFDSGRTVVTSNIDRPF